MAFLRSDRFAAIALALAAVVGLLVANSNAGSAVVHFFETHLSVSSLGLDLSLHHWITDGLLSVFFFIVAVDLRHEFTHGHLNSVRKALVPTAAAIGGVVIPALLFILLAGPGNSTGWPIPVATDIAFALGLIALVGRSLPTRIRVFLLALAVIDDLIAIVIIAVVFAQGINIGMLLGAAVMLALFWQAGKVNRIPALRPVLLLIFAFATWYLVYESGVHATIAGVALGLTLKPDIAKKVAHALIPLNNAFLLPLFAFVSALVIIPSTPLWKLSSVFWAIVIALPVGKIVGICIGGGIANRFFRRDDQTGVLGWDLFAVAAVGGIGFTVSLLMNDLALATSPELRDQGVLAVLTGSAIAVVVGGLLIFWRARVHARIGNAGQERGEHLLDPGNEV